MSIYKKYWWLFSGGERPLIFTADTTKAGSANDTLVIPMSGSGATPEAIISWGDGDTSTVTSFGNNTHTYAAPGVYEIRITGHFGAGNIRYSNTGDCLKIIGLKQWGDVVWGTLLQTFMGCKNIVTTYTDTPIMAVGSKSFASMIYDCLLWTSPINNFNYTGATSYQQLAMNSAINESFANLPLANVASGGSDMTNILTNTDMTSVNVDATLNGWWAQAPSIPSNVSIRIGAGVRTSASDTAVTGLTSAPYNWTITNP